MSRKRFAVLLLAIAGALFLIDHDRGAGQEASFTRQEDVIYGRKYGTALTMDVFKPKAGANGAAIVWVVSGGFFSSHESIRPEFVTPLLVRGYTVFPVVHGSQPRYQVPEIVQDVNRAVRFIRLHAKDYGIDASRIGATGASAGGHLSLMLGTAAAKGNAEGKDPVDRESSRVQAVACFFPPTDLLNFGAPGRELIRATDHRPPFRAAFDYRELDKTTMLWERVTDADKLRKIARDISPIYHVSSDTAPTFILHGDKDDLVPLQQSETFIAKLKEAGVEGKLVVKQGAGHGWLDLLKDLDQLGDWFDRHLGKGARKGNAKRNAPAKAGGAGNNGTAILHRAERPVGRDSRRSSPCQRAETPCCSPAR
jgi:acetyl esterase/lipase